MISYKLWWEVRNLVESCYLTPPTPEYIPTNVACPDCNEELLMDTHYTMLSCSVKRHAKCSKCEWSGYM